MNIDRKRWGYGYNETQKIRRRERDFNRLVASARRAARKRAVPSEAWRTEALG